MNKLTLLRSAMKEAGVDAFLQPVHDEYMGEYPPACHRRLEWLTGFSGSAGTVVVTMDKAALFTDGRYTLQALAESPGFEQHNSGTLSPEAWLAEQASEDARVGYDPKITSADMLRRYERSLEMLVPVANLIDQVWIGRPAEPISAVQVHELKYSGEESVAKRQKIAKRLVDAGADMAVLTVPEGVNWLLNIRGSDIENTPMVLCFAIIDAEANVRLYIDAARCDANVRKHLGAGVQGVSPTALEDDLKAMGQNGAHVMCDPSVAPVWFAQVLEEAGATVIHAQDPTLLPKACKNAAEVSGMRAAHIRDGAAIAKLLYWLDSETTKRSVKELEVCDRLLTFRAEYAMFREPSFATISGSGPNGAIVHYRSSEKTNRAIGKDEIFLLDSGGQYPDGTTDITRTVVIGNPTPEQKDRFTRVLKGHIAIALASFPVGTAGSQLDALARQYLWQAELDYDHGTGHGVGSFLSVHEGPQRISKRGGDAALKPGMIVSNEPGYYKAGEYGIRIENLVTVVEHKAGWLGFETLTCAPIDTKLVDAKLMSTTEKDWLNHYHAWVEKELSPQLGKDEQNWLKAACAAL